MVVMTQTAFSYSSGPVFACLFCALSPASVSLLQQRSWCSTSSLKLPQI